MYSVIYADDDPGLPGTARLFPEQTGESGAETLIPAQKAPDSPSIPLYDAILSGYAVPGRDRIAFLKAVREQSGDMPGKGNYEYAVPFKGTRRPLLTGLMHEPDEKNAEHDPDICRTKKSLTAQTGLPRPEGHRISVPAWVWVLHTTAPVRSLVQARPCGTSQP